jgi:uncharacterized membrane protein YciS (DUF1049 family)
MLAQRVKWGCVHLLTFVLKRSTLFTSGLTIVFIISAKIHIYFYIKISCCEFQMDKVNLHINLHKNWFS